VKALWKHRPSPAMVVAGVALTVALGGTGYAAISLAPNSVGTRQLKNGAVNSLKVKDGSLLKTDFKAGQLSTGSGGAAGAAGPTGATGPAGPFPDTLPAGKTIRGAYNIGSTAAAAGGLANTSISFIFLMPSAPTVRIVLQGGAAPAACGGNATVPQADAGFLCIYEESRTNTAGVTLNAVNRSGATIFVNSTAAGGFFSYGTWAVTAG
jgi:hypothetical protein